MITPLVSIIIPTFNHERFIGQAIESVLMQKCNFKFQIIIGDDFSRDSTRSICVNFLNLYKDIIVLLPSIKNIGLVLNYKQLIEASSSKYIAILEGDDYWIDKYKLQFQVDILENDSSIGLVHTRSCSLYENGDLKLNTHLRNSNKVGQELFEEIVCGKYTISPLTVCFRRDVFEKFVNYEFCILNNLKTIDFFLWSQMSIYTKFYFLDKVTGHYRILENSISNSKDFDKFKIWFDKAILTLDYYKSNYKISKKSKNIMYNNILSNAVTISLENKQYDFAKYASKNIFITDFKTFFIYFLGRYSILHFLFPMYKSNLLFLSSTKQYILSLRNLAK
jgi:glycosyltransferase involved in cell wall biosynthesis